MGIADHQVTFFTDSAKLLLLLTIFVPPALDFARPKFRHFACAQEGNKAWAKASVKPPKRVGGCTFNGDFLVPFSCLPAAGNARQNFFLSRSSVFPLRQKRFFQEWILCNEEREREGEWGRERKRERKKERERERERDVVVLWSNPGSRYRRTCGCYRPW